MTAVDDLPATQYLLLETLAARYRLGEMLWTFPRKQGVTRALDALSRAGLVHYDSGVVEGTWLASLTDQARREMFDGPYTPPGAARSTDEIRVRVVDVIDGRPLFTGWIDRKAGDWFQLEHRAGHPARVSLCASDLSTILDRTA